MLKKLIFLFLLIMSVEAYQLSICAIFKNEAQFLKEWIEYHRLIGVDHFYLYNNSSTDRPGQILKQYMEKNIVTVINWPDYTTDEQKTNAVWAISTQQTAYQHCVKIYGYQTQWLVFLAVDEFLVPIERKNILSLVKNYGNCDGIILPTQCFDASEKHSSQLTIEHFYLISQTITANNDVLKIIFRPKSVKSYSGFPFTPEFKEGQKIAKLDASEACVNVYENRRQWKLNQKRNINIGNQILSEKETKDVLGEGFRIEDQKKSIQFYLPELRKKMGILE